MTNHERPVAFRRMARGEASPAEARRIVRHLLAGCSRCLEIADKIRQEPGDPASWDYDAAFDRVAKRVARVIQPARAGRQHAPDYACAHH